MPEALFACTATEHPSRFGLTDYALANSLIDQHTQRWLMLSYDIWCSYQVKLKERFTKMFPSSAAIIDNMRGAVPKMHIKNHIEACQQLWAFNYQVHSGDTFGELVETTWGENNQTSGSTSEQNDGHRHDTLDDFWHYWNWTKLRKIGMCVFKMK